MYRTIEQNKFKVGSSAYFYPTINRQECWTVKILTNYDTMCEVRFDGIQVPLWASKGCPGPLRENTYLAHTTSLVPRHPEQDDYEKTQLWSLKVATWKLEQLRARDLAEFTVYKKYKKSLHYLMGKLLVSFKEYNDGSISSGILKSVDQKTHVCRILSRDTIVLRDFSDLTILDILEK